jgi:hypothetical protein
MKHLLPISSIPTANCFKKPALSPLPEHCTYPVFVRICRLGLAKRAWNVSISPLLLEPCYSCSSCFIYSAISLPVLPPSMPKRLEHYQSGFDHGLESVRVRSKDQLQGNILVCEPLEILLALWGAHSWYSTRLGTQSHFQSKKGWRIMLLSDNSIEEAYAGPRSWIAAVQKKITERRLSALVNAQLDHDSPPANFELRSVNLLLTSLANVECTTDMYGMMRLDYAITCHCPYVSTPTMLIHSPHIRFRPACCSLWTGLSASFA